MFNKSSFSKILLSMRMGRSNDLINYLNTHPNAINEKIMSGFNVKESFLDVSVRLSDTNLFLLLLNRGAKETPATSPDLLSRSAMNANSIISVKLVEMGWDPWLYSGNLGNPISISISSGNFDIIWEFEKCGVNLFSSDENGNNILHYICKSINCLTLLEKKNPKFLDFVDYILKKDELINKKNKYNNTPIELSNNDKITSFLKRKWEDEISKREKTNILLALEKENVISNNEKKKRKM